MSVNCVDATIELANDFEIPILLIASRRQIDSKEFDGGYVNNWDTKEYANYVTGKDVKGKILLARDHGGPWQNDKEKSEKLNLCQAMESAKRSYKADIDAGFKILHIDPSIDIHNNPTVNEILERVFELYEFCVSYAQRKGKEIIFEVGTEEQSGGTNSQEELEYSLNAIQQFCKQNSLLQPSFIVVQTGTRVMETKNVGTFDSPIRILNELPAEIQVPKTIEICNRYKILMKEHNTDYLSNEALQWHPRLGIHSANVAPEFGVAETKALVTLFKRNKLQSMTDRFLELAYNSMKWKKWMLPNTGCNDTDRAIIAGHYVFSTDCFRAIKDEAIQCLQKKGISVDLFLKESVKKSILRYLQNFRLIR